MVTFMMFARDTDNNVRLMTQRNFADRPRSPDSSDADAGESPIRAKIRE
jgi:hypothetical protein